MTTKEAIRILKLLKENDEILGQADIEAIEYAISFLRKEKEIKKLFQKNWIGIKPKGE